MNFGFGIDFGTSRSSLAASFGKGEAGLLYDSSNPEGNSFYPSVVLIQGDGTAVTGWLALEKMATAPERGALGFKPWILSSKSLGLPEKSYSAFELLGFLLQDLKALAERKLAVPVSEAVMSHPAAWKEEPKGILLEMARNRGFEKIAFVPEPCAAAYALPKNMTGTVVICDYGAGHFSIALVNRKNEGSPDLIFELHDDTLGGNAVDEKVAERFLEEIELDCGKVLKKDSKIGWLALREAERAKRSLSHRGSWDVRLNREDAGIDFKRAFSRYELTEMMEPQLKGIEHLCQQARASQEDVKSAPFVLIGGMSRNLAVREILSKVFGKKPEAGIPTDFLIAQGAALLGEQLAVHGR